MFDVQDKEVPTHLLAGAFAGAGVRRQRDEGGENREEKLFHLTYLLSVEWYHPPSAAAPR